MKAPFVFEGTCNREIFSIYLEKIVVPELHEGEVIIMDNASIHKGGNIESIIEQAGCKLIYLPPYSPDLNP